MYLDDNKTGCKIKMLKSQSIRFPPFTTSFKVIRQNSLLDVCALLATIIIYLIPGRWDKNVDTVLIDDADET